MAHRRSTRPHPQIHASEEGDGMARRRSPRLHPQIQPSADGAGVTCRRSPRLHPQIHASEEVGAGMPRRIRRRRAGTSPEAADASLPDDDDLLREILLRLPPQPSSLPRAAAVCRRWRGLVTDPKFHRQFYAHHRKPPLLGVFSCGGSQGIVFTPILGPPNRITSLRFSLGHYSNSWGYNVLDCRHGLLLVKNEYGTDVVLCNPITNEQHRLDIPPELRADFLAGAVLCAASHLGGCNSSPFKVVLVSTGKTDGGDLACVYSSDTGVWGDLILTGAPCEIHDKPAVLVGNCLYWLSLMHIIVKFDLDENSITVIEGPPVTFDISYQNSQITQAEGGVVGFAALSYPRFQMWRRNDNGHGVATWVHWKTIAMCTILGSPTERMFGRLLGYDEDTDVLFLSVGDRVYMVELKSMQSRKLHKIIHCTTDCYYPFTSFYTPAAAPPRASSPACRGEEEEHTEQVANMKVVAIFIAAIAEYALSPVGFM